MNDTEVEQYKPLCRFHENEDNGPCSINSFLLECQLYNEEHGNLINNVGELTTTNICHKPSTSELRWLGVPRPIGASSQISTPMYTATGIIPETNELFCRYTMFYSYQPTIIKSQVLRNYLAKHDNADSHVMDSESFTVHLNATSRVFNRAYMSAHTSKMGKWVTSQAQLEWSDDHPVLYIARNTHAIYNEPKKYHRLFGLVSDDCTQNKTYSWLPTVVHWNTMECVASYPGKWPNGYGSHWFTRMTSGLNPPQSANAFDRAFAFWKW